MVPWAICTVMSSIATRPQAAPQHPQTPDVDGGFATMPHQFIVR